jgi:hypothetical protein
LRGQELLHGSLAGLAVGRSATVNLWGSEANTAIAIRQQKRCTRAAIRPSQWPRSRSSRP